MRSILKARTLLLLVIIAMLAVACAADDADDTTADATDAVGDAVDEATEAAGDATDAATEAMTDDTATEDEMATEEDMATEDMSTEGGDSAAASAEICDMEALVEAVESGPEEGTLAGMADDPVGTAASSNPVLTTLVTAVSAAGLVDTLNSAEALTVFAPTDCAFAEFDPATLEAAMADPTGLLTTVLGYHVIPGEMIASADLTGQYEAFTGEMITVEGTDVDGQATIVVPDIQTANATVHLIDTVMVPPSVSGASAEGDAGATEGATEDATEG